jgi:hypothetical protein
MTGNESLAQKFGLKSITTTCVDVPHQQWQIDLVMPDDCEHTLRVDGRKSSIRQLGKAVSQSIKEYTEEHNKQHRGYQGGNENTEN